MDKKFKETSPWIGKEIAENTNKQADSKSEFIQSQIKRDNELYIKLQVINKRIQLLEEAMVYCVTVFKEMESKGKLTDIKGNILTK